MATSDVLSIPVIESPFKYPEDPRSKQCMFEAVEWAVKCGIVGSVEDYCITNNPVYYIPQMDGFDYDMRLFYAKAVILIFSYDDIFDATGDSKQLQRFADFWDAFVEETELAPVTPLENACVQLLAELRKYYKMRPVAANQRYNKAIMYLLQGLKMERRIEKKYEAIPLEDYQVYRYYTIAFEISWGLIADAFGVFGLTLPAVVASNMVMVELKDTLIRIEYMINDLVSVKKELRDNAKSNVVIILKNKKRYSCWQSAIDEVVSMTNDEVKTFQMLEKFVPSFGAEYDEIVHHYIVGLKKYIQVIYDYSFKSKRYATCQ